jgi:hypothetical protein
MPNSYRPADLAFALYLSKQKDARTQDLLGNIIAIQLSYLWGHMIRLAAQIRRARRLRSILKFGYYTAPTLGQHLTESSSYQGSCSVGPVNDPSRQIILPVYFALSTIPTSTLCPRLFKTDSASFGEVAATIAWSSGVHNPTLTPGRMVTCLPF